jgi:dTDP-D-glucose 4,6-dehydratase
MYCVREKENIMTIIVTGGAGFIGSNFIFHMLKKYPDYRIICLGGKSFHTRTCNG